MEGGGVWLVGGVWSTGSAGAIGSDCGQVSAIRPNQEVCIYASAFPFSRGKHGERRDARESRSDSGQRGREPGRRVLIATDRIIIYYDLLVFAVWTIKANRKYGTPTLSPPTP